jgi:hypothetical protein
LQRTGRRRGVGVGLPKRIRPQHEDAAGDTHPFCASNIDLSIEFACEKNTEAPRPPLGERGRSGRSACGVSGDCLIYPHRDACKLAIEGEGTMLSIICLLIFFGTIAALMGVALRNA